MIALLCAVVQGAWADAGDSAENPITISSESDWNTFASNVSSGNSYSGKFVKLTADISVSEMVGTSDHKFQGSFLGDGVHTLTFNKGTAESAFNEQYCAPFRYTDGATFKDLKVAGDIYTSSKFAAGLVSSCYGTTTITNCHVSTVIHSSVSGDGTHGGMVAMPSNTLNITGCVYDGRMFTTSGTSNCGGFVGWHNGATNNITKSLYAPNPNITPAASEVAITTDCGTFVRGGSAGTGCYYTETMGTAQGSLPYTSAPANEISYQIPINSTPYYVPCTISGVSEKYYYTGSEISVVPTVTYFDTSLTLNTDYTATLDGNAVESFPIAITTKGYHTFTFTGKGNCTGTKSILFYVVGELDGLGNQDNPYTIGSADDWKTFAENVNYGRTYSGKFVKLTADISVTQKVGVVSGYYTQKAFSGTFDGNGHTITATITDNSNDGTALFCYINGATIKNLNLAGTITSDHYDRSYAAALVGYSRGGGSNIQNCMVSANVYGSYIVGGIVGTDNSNIRISGCVFSGLMTSSISSSKGAFIGFVGTSNKAAITNCLYVMADGQNTTELDLVIGATKVTFTNCYKTTDAGSQGMQPYTSAPANEISEQITINNTTYYTTCLTGGVEDYYLYTGSPITITPTITGFTSTLTEGTDYTYTFSPTTVQAMGDYTITITGAGSYTGTKTIPFHVVDMLPVTSKSTTLSASEYTLFSDVTISSRITISGNVVLNLSDGATLTAPKGIELSEGNSLTINGPGALTINGCDGYKSGIGAGRVGTLTINGGTINVTGAPDAAGIGGDMNNSSGGTIIINGGVVNASGGTYGAGIGGGCWGVGNSGICGTIIINGGKVRATGGSSAPGIGPGYCTFDGSYNCGSLTLGWTNPDDFFYSSGFTNGNSRTLSSITFNNSFVLEGTSTIATSSNIAGKTIVPYLIDASYALADGTAYTIVTTTTYSSATYTKSLDESRVGKYQSWLVPFDYTITDLDTEKFTFYKINMIANAPNPQTNATDQMWVFLKQMSAGNVLHANMPYVYKPKEAVTDYAFTTTNASLMPKNTGVIAKTETMEEVYNFYATYGNTTATAQDPFYYVNINGDLSYGDEVTVGAFRWVIRVENKFGNPIVSYAREIHFFDGEEETTKVIELTTTNFTNNTNSESWFTLDGRKLDGKPARKGIYICNGKKVVRK